MFKIEISFLTTFRLIWSEKKFLSELIWVSPIPSRLARELKLKDYKVIEKKRKIEATGFDTDYSFNTSNRFGLGMGIEKNTNAMKDKIKKIFNLSLGG